MDTESKKLVRGKLVKRKALSDSVWTKTRLQMIQDGKTNEFVKEKAREASAKARADWNAAKKIAHMICIMQVCGKLMTCQQMMRAIIAL